MGELRQLMFIGQSFKDSAQVKLLQKIKAGDEQRLLLVILAYSVDSNLKVYHL